MLQAFCLLVIDLFEMSSPENSPKPGTSSGAYVVTYADVVQGKSLKSAPLQNDFSRVKI